MSPFLFEASEAKSKKSYVTEGVEKKFALKEEREANKIYVEPEKQWNIDAIHANRKEYAEVDKQVKVAVMDTGVTMSSDIELAGRVNLIEGEEDVHPLYEDVSGHGTAVASVIAAKENNIGITGINPNVELYSVKVLMEL